MNKLVNTVPIDIFYYPIYRYIYKIIHHLYCQSEEINILKIEKILLQDSAFIKEGGINIFSRLINMSINHIDINEHINALMELYMKREFLKYLMKMIAISYTSCSCYLILKTADIILNYLKNLVINSNLTIDNTTESTQELFPKLFTDMIYQSRKKTSFSGICSGYADFDSITKGLQKQDLIIIAGRPGMGKTTFALNIILNIVKQQKPSIIFSLEMSKKELLYKLTAIQSTVPTELLQTGALDDIHWKKLIQAGRNLQDFPLFIDDSSSLTPINIKEKILNLKIENLGIIMVDYLQLIQYPNFEENRLKELSFITRSLKSLARELNIPIIVLSQLSRLVETRINKRPFLSDLRESGCIISDSIISYFNITRPMYRAYKNYFATYIQVFMTFNWNNYYIPHYKYFYTGYKQIYTIYSYFDAEISLTANHQIFTQHGWKKVNYIERLDATAILHNNNPIIKLYLHTSIIWTGKSSVYDIEADKYHNFIANQFLVHNSIEQDADLVCMMYRDDYYTLNENNTDEMLNNSSKSITEIHIVKHRKGRTGIFELEFDKTISKFNSFNL